MEARGKEERGRKVRRIKMYGVDIPIPHGKGNLSAL